jgi:hypothetical protein
MSELDDHFSDDSSSEMSLTPSQSASQSSGSFTNLPHAGGDAFSTLRRARSVKDQLEVVDEANLSAEVGLLPKIWMHDKPYIKTKWLHKKRKRWSKVDEYGERYVKLDRDDSSLGEYWLCNLCMQQGRTSLYATTNGATTNAKSHLQKDHRLLIGIESSDGDNEADHSEPSPRRQKTLQESLRKALVTKTTGQLFRNTLLGWLVGANIPLSGIEHPLFRQLLCLLNKDLLQELLPHSGDTVRAWMKAEFEAEKELLKNELARSPYKKHLTFDLWTSPNQYALLGITVHFVDHSQQLQFRLLALKRIFGSHGGENLGPVLQGVIEDFALFETIGYLTADNADSGNSAARELFQALLPQDDSAPDLARRRRIRCVNHELNLGATGFLDGTFKEAIKKLPPLSEERQSLQEENDFLENWRQSGSIQRLHNLMGWIRRGAQRREQFLQLTRGELTEEDLLEFGQVLWDTRELGGLMVKQDNDTRWNSFFESAKRALQLKDPIEVFQRRMVNEKDPKKRLPEEYLLRDDDWRFLGIAVDVLEPVFRLTKRFEDRGPRIAEVAASLHYLLDHFRRQRSIYVDDIANPAMDGPDFAGASVFVGHQLPALQPIAPPNTQSEIFSDRPQRERRQPARYRDGTNDAEIAENDDSSDFADRQTLRALRASLAVAIYKIDKYVATLEDSPAYWAAMILHPGLKKRWIEKHLSEEHAQRIIQGFKKFFDQDYNKQSSPAPGQSAQTRPNYLIDDDFYDKPEDLLLKHEITEYFSMPLLPVEDPLEWWRQHQTSLPKLARMAFDILSIPATSCEVERVFSQSKLTISTQRHRLMDETIELLVCLKYWLPNRVF